MTPLAELRALTVRQPWAWALITGHKDIENRSWSTNVRGWILLHAGTRRPAEHDLATAAIWAGTPMPADEPRGSIVGAIKIAGIHPYESCHGQCSAWAIGEAWHWEMTEPHRFAIAVPSRGALQLWRPDPDVLTAVRGQLPGGQLP